MGVDRNAVALKHARRCVRLLRYVLYLSIIGMIFWLTSNFSFVQLERGDASVVGVSGFRKILVKKTSGEAARMERGALLVFAMLDREDRQIFRISRVRAAPGDRVEAAGAFYAVNGEATNIPRSKAVGLEGTVPEGFYLLVNDNPVSPYPDSLSLGLIDHRWVVGRYLSEMPF